MKAIFICTPKHEKQNILGRWQVPFTTCVKSIQTHSNSSILNFPQIESEFLDVENDAVKGLVRGPVAN